MQRLLAALALALVSCPPTHAAPHPIDCLSEATLRTEKPQILIVDAATGKPLRDAAVWQCPDEPHFKHFGGLLLDARFDRPGEPGRCNYLVSRPGYETREVRRDGFAGADGGETTGPACVGREPVDVIRLRPRPGAREVPQLESSGREAFVSPDGELEENGTAKAIAAQGLVLLPDPPFDGFGGEIRPGVRVGPRSGRFQSLDDPRLVALARQTQRVQDVGWFLGPDHYCTHRLYVSFHRLDTLDAAEAALAAGRLTVVEPPRPSGSTLPETYLVETFARAGAHRGMVPLARRVAARMPVGTTVTFECHVPIVLD